MIADQNQEDNVGPVWQRGSHMPHLDGVRGLAILIVTIYRFAQDFPTDTMLGKTLHATFSMGDRGVELFFVLSGFLITGILFDAKNRSHYFRDFYARRSLRIFPLYFVALFIFLFVLGLFEPFRETFADAKQRQFFLWTYLSNIKMSLEGAGSFEYLNHFWSLAVEEHFYLFWPFVIFFCTRRTALKLAVALSILSIASRVGFMVAYPDNAVATKVFTFFRCDALLSGACLALLIRGEKGLQPIQRWTNLLLVPCLFLAVACEVSQRRLLTIAFTVWPVFWCCLFVWLLTSCKSSWIARVFDFGWLKNLGKYSYAMYVFQNPLIPLMAGVVSVPLIAAWTSNLIVANFIYITVMSILTYAMALLSWHLLEKHCLRLKHWFSHQPPCVADPESADSGQMKPLKAGH